MESFMNTVMDFFKTASSFVTKNMSTEMLIYIVIAILTLILIWIVSRTIKSRKANRRINNLELEVNEIRNNSLQYKYNKASAFARVNDDIMDRVKKLAPKYEVCLQNIAECEDLFTEADDYLAGHRIKRSMEAMDELESILDETKERIRIVTQSLDHVLKQETEVREHANALKERFGNVKKVYNDNRSSYYSAAEYIDGQLAIIEDEFSNFEEWMFASEFNKAKEEQEKISKMVDVISSSIAACPGYYDKAKVVLPRALEEVKTTIAQLSTENIDLSYLDPENKIEAIEKAMAETVSLLDQGEFETANSRLDEIGDHILALQDDVLSEKQAYDEIHNNLEDNLSVLDEIEVELKEIVTLYTNIKDRFGLEDWTQRFMLANEQLDVLKASRKEIVGMLKEDDQTSVELVHKYREYAQAINDFSIEVKDMKKMLVGASSDESRAKKQLVKLQLILNEVRLSAMTHNLPSISSSFEEDIKEGEKLISRVRIVLDHSPLDVQTLNADLQDAIDFVYRLYNNANNLIGVAVMVENAIVFGNRFRSTYPAIDSDLTRAELCFQNGEYTRALKIAIQAIENMHPGVYEKLIARKDPAVMNVAQ